MQDWRLNSRARTGSLPGLQSKLSSLRRCIMLGVESVCPVEEGVWSIDWSSDQLASSDGWSSREDRSRLKWERNWVLLWVSEAEKTERVESQISLLYSTTRIFYPYTTGSNKIKARKLKRSSIRLDSTCQC